jgi:arabinogalactan oligomer / maltooligosaccharide transport system permease protein
VSATTVDADAIPEADADVPIRPVRMPFTRWLRLVGWRHAIAILFVIWALVPAFYVVTLAFSGGNTLTAACPPDKTGVAALSCLVPQKLSLDNFRTLLESDQWPFLTWMRNTLVLCTVNAAAALFIGAAAAYAFSRMRFTGRRPGLLSLMLVQMFPSVLAITAIYALMTRMLDISASIGLGSVGGLLLVYLGTALGVNTFLMKGYFDTIPVEIDESARIDGAGHARIFFGLVLRLAVPILIVVYFVTFQATFNELPIAQVVLPDQQNTTVDVGLYGLVSNPLVQQWGLVAAGGVMAAIPLFVLFLLVQKQLVTGLTSGAVKG